MGLVRNLRPLFPLSSDRKIVSYRTVYYAPEEDGDEIEQDEGEEHEVEEFDDPEESDDGLGLTWTEAAYDYLVNRYVSEASSSHYHDGIWYTAGDESWDVNGEIEEITFHLKGFSPDEEEEIYRLLKSRKNLY